MKLGLRKPNLKSRIKAKTVGKVKRQVKRAVNPLYGKPGMGLVNNPRKSIYIKIYSKTTVEWYPKIKTKMGKSIYEYNDVSDFWSDADIDTITLFDIDEMDVEAAEAVYLSNQSGKMNKENKWKMQRISSKIALREIVPPIFALGDGVRTKSGKSRHDFSSDFKYLANLDLSTFSEDDIDEMDIELIQAIYKAKNNLWKRRNEKSIFKRIRKRYIEDVIL